MKLFTKSEIKTLWPFYLESFVSYVLMFAPMFLIVYLRDIGLSMTQIGFLVAVFPLASLIFEIPTGAIADLYGRKFSVITGYILEGILIMLLILSKNYYYIMIIFILWNIAGTLYSGAQEAWITDLIKSKKGKYLHDYFIKERSIKGFALVISGIIGALMVKQFGVIIVWPIAGFACLMGAGVLTFAKEDYVPRKIKISESFKDILKQTKKSVSYSTRHHVLFYFLLAGFFIMFAAMFGQAMGWVPFLQELNFPDYAFGYMWSAMWCVAAIAPLFSKRLLTKEKERNFIVINTIIASFIFLLIYFARSWAYALIILLFAVFFVELKGPVERIYFHKFIPKKLRATIGSVEAMFLSLAGIIALPIAGYLIDKIGARYVIILSAILMIPAVVCYLMIREKK